MNKMINNSLFITGTDTSVGKTFVSARLLEFLRTKGIQAGYQKWVATGVEAEMPEDLALCLDAAGISSTPELVAQQVPYCFKFPASPHLAAKMEDRTVKTGPIKKNYETLAARYEWLIVEGVGGLMVPLRRDLLLADLLAQLQPKTLLVAKSGLGTLNHTLLTLEALRHRNIPVFGIVFSDTDAVEDEKLVQDNMQTIQEIGRVRVFGRLQRYKNASDARRGFLPIGNAILEQLHHIK